MIYKNEICPFCKSKLINNVNNNVYLCKNCGCVFNKNYKNKLNSNPEEITKEEFFNIIFEALENVLMHEINLDDRKNIEEMYNIKTYYKEIALAQAEMILEISCTVSECEIFTKLIK